MKLKNKVQKGFSLVEFAIVVGIFAVLAAIALPNGTSVKNAADYSSIAEVVHTMETAEAVYEVNNNALATVSQLLANGALNSAPLQDLAVGTSATMAIVQAGTASGASAPPNGYDLNGDGTVDVGATTGTTNVAELTILGVTPEDANAVGLRIDGATNTGALTAGSIALDAKGRVENAAITTGNTGTLKIFVARR